LTPGSRLSERPTARFGVDLEASYGSANSWRTFVRLNSGDLPWGGRLALSYAHDRQGKWKGWGKQVQDQINAKYVQPLGDGVTSTTFLDLIDRRERRHRGKREPKRSRPTFGWHTPHHIA